MDDQPQPSSRHRLHLAETRAESAGDASFRWSAISALYTRLSGSEDGAHPDPSFVWDAPFRINRSQCPIHVTVAGPFRLCARGLRSGLAAPRSASRGEKAVFRPPDVSLLLRSQYSLNENNGRTLTLTSPNVTFWNEK